MQGKPPREALRRQQPRMTTIRPLRFAERDLADGKILIATSETSNMAHFIDTKSFEIVDNVLVGTRPRFAEFTADGSQLWVTSEVGGTVSVIDAKTRKIIKTIGFEIPGIRPESMQPVGVRVLKDGSKAFVALGPANHVAVIDAKKLEVEQYLLVGQRVWQLGADARREIAVHHQRQQQRRVGDRRAEPESGEVDAGRHGALGRHHLAKLSRA